MTPKEEMYLSIMPQAKALLSGETDLISNMAKLEAISYDPVHHKYPIIGEAVGNAFSNGKQLK